jgi:hypothetical protein
MEGYWENNTLCGDSVWREFPTFTSCDAAYQCSNCPVQDGKAWRDGLYIGKPNHHVSTKSRCPCQTNCPMCFSGPLLD